MVLVYEVYNFNRVLSKWNFVSRSSHSSPPLVWLKLTQLATQRSLWPRFTKIRIASKLTWSLSNRCKESITKFTRTNVARYQIWIYPTALPAKARWSSKLLKETRLASKLTRLKRLNTTNATKELVTLTLLRIERSLNTWEVSISLP